jgi:hypothetical protein
MASEAMMIRTEAAKLYKRTQDAAIADYRTMSLDDLKAHIARINKGGSSVANGKAATNGNAVKGKSAPAATVVKGKASTSAPAKSTAQKTMPAKGAAAQGTAKRQTSAATKGKATSTKGATAPAKGKASATPAVSGWQPGSRGRVPASATKAQLKEHERIRKERLAAPKPKVSRAPKAGTTVKRGKAGQVTGRAAIDNSAVDWSAPWGGGQRGKRAVILAALRKFKGNKDKVFAHLEDQADELFPDGGHLGNSAKMLRWNIGRVAFDFANETGQHEQGTRVAYGTSDSPAAIKRREATAAAREAAAKAERAAKRAASAKGKVAPARKASPVKGKGK